MRDKLNKLIASPRFTVALTAFGLFLLASGISYAVFSYLSGSRGTLSPQPGGVEKTRSRINLDLPKTEECPINGGKFTSQEREIWESRRPAGIMIENHVDSRPPSGLSRADVVYEAVAEGGITRFLAIFYCGASAEDSQVAPVRSVRMYFVDWIAEYGANPLLVHVGGGNNYGSRGPGEATAKEARALEALVDLGWRIPGGNDIDTTYDAGFPTLWRNKERLDHQVAAEHEMMSSTDRIWEEAQKRGLAGVDEEGVRWDKNFVKWRFIDENPKEAVSSIDLSFWNNQKDYDVSWKWDKETNRYLRENGGKAHIDLENKEQLAAKNVVVLYQIERSLGDKERHLAYKTTGSGKALVFQNGQVLEGTWKKSDRRDRTKILDKSGKEIAFVRGPIWFEIVLEGNSVIY